MGTRQRFFAQVRVDPCGCHLWTGTTSKSGREGQVKYGRFQVGDIKLRAHHIAWFLVKGELPEFGLMHTCDTPLCVNVEHLVEGTQAQNMADMVAKGRQSRGEARHNAVLTMETAQEIRSLRSTGLPYSRIAAMFGIGMVTAFDVCAGKTWRV